MRPQASPRIEQPREQDQQPEKSNRAFRTISEVAEVLDTPAHVLRFWESKFSQIKPMKRGGGRRYYRPEDVSLLRGIKELLYVDGLTIKGVQKVLRERGHKYVAGLGVDEVAPTDVTDTLARLEELRNRLKAG